MPRQHDSYPVLIGQLAKGCARSRFEHICNPTHFFSSLQIEAGTAAAQQVNSGVSPFPSWDPYPPAKSGPKLSP